MRSTLATALCAVAVLFGGPTWSAEQHSFNERFMAAYPHLTAPQEEPLVVEVAPPAPRVSAKRTPKFRPAKVNKPRSAKEEVLERVPSHDPS
jgi:hypothetical protein